MEQGKEDKAASAETNMDASDKLDLLLERIGDMDRKMGRMEQNQVKMERRLVELKANTAGPSRV